MAAPPQINIKNLSGKYILNKTLSDDVDALLTLQGLSWFTRKAISLATVVLTIKEYTKDSTYHIDITSVAASVSTTQENRTLNWTDATHSDRIFGTVIGKSRIFSPSDFSMEGPGGPDDAKFLKAEVLKDIETPSKFLEDDGGRVQSWAVSQNGKEPRWTAEQIWGFEDVGGKRYYTRRVVVRKGDEVQRVRLVYDYTGKVEEARDESDDLAYGD